MSCRGITEPTAEDRSNIDFLVFRNGKIEVVNGTATKAELNLTNFFTEADSFLSQEFELLAEDDLILSTANIGRLNGEVKFIAILVEYPEDTEAEDKYLEWKYPYLKTVVTSPGSPTTPSIELEEGQTMNLGEIMILSGSTLEDKGWDLSSIDGSPIFGGLGIINPHTDIDVEVKVLIVR